MIYRFHKYLRFLKHCLKGSPVNPSRQVHMGEWFTTIQSAFAAHVPGHGSIHLFLIHALLLEQSELTKHSGWQPSYGFPKYPFTHRHAPAPALSSHSVFGPHGDGVHGDICSFTGISLKMHCTAASPINPSGHIQIGVWLTTRHSAFFPQASVHGFWHFLLIHAIWGAHSLLAIHSGRQFGGAPMKSGIHWHDGISLMPLVWHIALGPQGDGWQGFFGVVGTLTATIVKTNNI